jgi:hypothetical protein
VIDEAVAQVEKHTPPLEVSIYKNYSPDIPPFPFGSPADRARAVQFASERRASQSAAGSVTVKTRQLGDTVEIDVIDRGAGIAPKGPGKHLQSVLHHQVERRGIGLGHRVEDRR